MVTLASTRFGSVEVADDAVIDFPSGLIGLPGRRYALLPDSADSDFNWLHSADHPHIAIPVSDPLRWFEGFAIALSGDDMARVGATDLGHAAIRVAIRMDHGSGHLTANLRAPIVVLNALGHQVINHARGASLRAPLAAPRLAA
jgi:flagellar assembly factor FliW